ncbi:MAG: hypothetical protein L0332_25470 [Chloroflexi bacterium]|nr:hypothetical protein [Chloroflexota bacterium]MCI0730048.1 hypothetical protein [Chloroflexota bacterium]
MSSVITSWPPWLPGHSREVPRLVPGQPAIALNRQANPALLHRKLTGHFNENEL